MVPRDTRTGLVLEQMIIPSLEKGGYTWQKQFVIGERLGGGKHRVDLLAKSEDGRRYLISLKWQQVSGTAEQKVPFEVICLAETVLNSPAPPPKAYVVLGGGGWKLRDFYVSGGLRRHLRHADLVNIVTLEDFVARANTGDL